MTIRSSPAPYQGWELLPRPPVSCNPAVLSLSEGEGHYRCKDMDWQSQHHVSIHTMTKVEQSSCCLQPNTCNWTTHKYKCTKLKYTFLPCAHKCETRTAPAIDYPLKPHPQLTVGAAALPTQVRSNPTGLGFQVQSYPLRA